MSTTTATTIRPKRAPKYPFILRDLDLENVCQKYGFSYNKELCDMHRPISKESVTKIDELDHQQEYDFSYLDETKNKRKFVIVMIDHTTKKNISKSPSRCFWCRNPFEYAPIGCPIKYVPHVLVKRYFSHITKDYYSIKEELTPKRYAQMILDTNPDNPPTTDMQFMKNDYYMTDGTFCSFNCCVAWIKDNSHIPIYKNSLFLIHDIYTRYFDVSLETCQIQPAPHWRMLKEYGGTMTIEDFHNTFNKIIYDNSQYVKHVPWTKPIGMMFEEFLKI